MGTDDVAATGRSITAGEWRQIVDSAVETAIITTDLAGWITSWNAGAERILGWNEARCSASRSIGCFLTVAARQRSEQEMREALTCRAAAAARKGGASARTAAASGRRRTDADPRCRRRRHRVHQGPARPVEAARGRRGNRRGDDARSRSSTGPALRWRSRPTCTSSSRSSPMPASSLPARSSAHSSTMCWTHGGESYMLYTLSGVPAEAFSKFPMPRNTAVFAPTFKGEGIVRSDDITRDPRYGHNAPRKGMPEGHLPVRSYLAVPVISRSGEVIGGLFFGHAEPAMFTAQSERGLSGLAARGGGGDRQCSSVSGPRARTRAATRRRGELASERGPAAARDRGGRHRHMGLRSRHGDAALGRALQGVVRPARPTRKSVMRTTFLAGLHPEDRERDDAAVQAALDPDGTGSYDVEYRTIGIEPIASSAGSAPRAARCSREARRSASSARSSI